MPRWLFENVLHVCTFDPHDALVTNRSPPGSFLCSRAVAMVPRKLTLLGMVLTGADRRRRAPVVRVASAVLRTFSAVSLTTPLSARRRQADRRMSSTFSRHHGYDTGVIDAQTAGSRMPPGRFWRNFPVDGREILNGAAMLRRFDASRLRGLSMLIRLSGVLLMQTCVFASATVKSEPLELRN